MDKFDTPYLTFRFLTHTNNIDLGDGKQYPIRFELREQETARGKAALPFFFLDDVHKIELADERVLAPVKRPGMTDRRHEEQVDAAYERAGEAEKQNAHIRKMVDMYAKAEVIQVLDDPFRNSGSREEAFMEVLDEGSLTPLKAEPTKPVSRSKTTTKRKMSKTRTKPAATKAKV